MQIKDLKFVSLAASFRQTGDFSGLSSLGERRGGIMRCTATQKWFSFLFEEGEFFPPCLSFY